MATISLQRARMIVLGLLLPFLGLVAIAFTFIPDEVFQITPEDLDDADTRGERRAVQFFYFLSLLPQPVRLLLFYALGSWLIWKGIKLFCIALAARPVATAGVDGIAFHPLLRLGQVSWDEIESLQVKPTWIGGLKGMHVTFRRSRWYFPALWPHRTIKLWPLAKEPDPEIFASLAQDKVAPGD